LRFFTVYGPWGRPDMAYFLFTRAILRGEAIDVFGNGDLERDFTYIDDIIEGVVRVMHRIPSADPTWSSDDPAPNTSAAAYRLYNIGNRNPVRVSDMIAVLERHLDRKARQRFLPIQPGDVRATFADVDDLERDVGFRPATPLEFGLRQFVDWYLDYERTAPVGSSAPSRAVRGGPMATS
jgi:UDP-glucuronate 4-epimerase